MRFLWSFLKLSALLLALVLVAGLAAFLTLQFATFSRTVEVPDVVGLSQTEATRRLDRAGLRILFEDEAHNVFDETVPRDHVVRQDPPAGAKLKENRKVRVVLSLGPRSLYVPRVVGEAVSAAMARLQEAGLGVGDVVYAANPAVPEDRVVDQQPRQLPSKGEARVSLLVSAGPPPPTYLMPDLIGRPGLRAQSFLELNGFRVVVESEPYEGVPERTVVRQKPLAGYPVRAGDSVWLWVSRASGAGLTR